MPKPIENISSELYDFLYNRLEVGNAEKVDSQGQDTSSPEDMKVFVFDFVNSDNKDCGCVMVSLLDDNRSTDSLKIYFGQEITDSDSKTKEEWFNFLKQLKDFAMMHMLGFDIRNLNKSRITVRDIEPMFESTFSPIDGTVKTSRQSLDGVDIIIKHSNKVNPRIKNSRSRKIHKIYISTSKGERFLMPFRSLVAARAMARHLANGGTPYDGIGSEICHLVDEMVSLRRFVRITKNREIKDTRALEAIQASQERYLEIKKQLSSMTTNGGYGKISPTLSGNKELEDEEYDDLFSDIDLDEDATAAIPHVMRAYAKRKAFPEQDEFEKWVAATKGEGEGDEMLLDSDKTVTESTNGRTGIFGRKGNYEFYIDGNKVPRIKYAQYLVSTKISPEAKVVRSNSEYGTYTERQYHYFIMLNGKKIGPEFNAGAKNPVVAAQDAIDYVKEHGTLVENKKKSCPDCENKVNGKWRVGRCDDCRGSGRTSTGKKCVNCLGAGSPVCCRCEGTGVDKNPDNTKVTESKKQKCPKCGSTKYSLMPSDFETAKCIKCGKNWNHGIVDGINNPEDLKEADAPSSAGWGSPLSFPKVSIPPKFHTNKEIGNMSDTTGALSPLSLLNKEEDSDGNDEDLERILHLSGHRKVFDREK